ncbi:MAG: sulfite exporter TauE/SafE family protein [Bacteroidetes bacterium]|nr:sulfite exporter TauE/SafE family protein [Bacteroidota bacterium]
MEILGYLASALIGVVLGLLGGGGSILTIPILVYLFKVDVTHATAYSLFIVGVTSLVGAIPKYKSQLVNLRTGTLFGLPSIIGIFATRKWIVPAIPETLFSFESFVFTSRILFLGLFAVMMVLAAVPMIRGPRVKQSATPRFRVLLIIVEGVLIGLVTGLVGAGGGFLIIPALVFLTDLPFKIAVGTSLYIISINSLLGFTGDLANLTMDWSLLLTVSLLATIGILFGNFASRHIDGNLLRKSFGWFTLAMGIAMIFKELMFQS